MKKEKTEIKIIKEKTGYTATAFIGNDFIGTEGESLDELKTNILEALNLGKDESRACYTPDDLSYTLDLQSFFDFYRVINAKALSEKIGMNQSLLAQYISGKKKPSPAQTARILNGVKQIAKELADIRLL